MFTRAKRASATAAAHDKAKKRKQHRKKKDEVDSKGVGIKSSLASPLEGKKRNRKPPKKLQDDSLATKAVVAQTARTAIVKVTIGVDTEKTSAETATGLEVSPSTGGAWTFLLLRGGSSLCFLPAHFYAMNALRNPYSRYPMLILFFGSMMWNNLAFSIPQVFGFPMPLWLNAFASAWDGFGMTAGVRYPSIHPSIHPSFLPSFLQ